MDKIINFLKWLWSKVGQEDPATGKTFLQEITEVAKPVVEDLLDKDLDGDGRISAYGEALDAATRYGLPHLKRILAGINPSLVDPDELKRLLAIARLIPLAKPILERFGVKLKYRWIEQAVSAAYLLLASDAD